MGRWIRENCSDEGTEGFVGIVGCECAGDRVKGEEGEMRRRWERV